MVADPTRLKEMVVAVVAVSLKVAVTTELRVVELRSSSMFGAEAVSVILGPGIESKRS